MRVAEKVVQQKEKQLEMARNRRAAGVATELEVLRFEVDLANARTTLLRLSGRGRPRPRGPERGDGAADRHARSSPRTRLEFRGRRRPTSEQVVREAIASRPEVKAVAWNEKIYDEAIGIYKADMQPRLDFNGAYGWSVRETANFFESNYKKWSLAVTLKIPVFDGWRTAGKVAQARADRAKVGQDRVALETQIDLEAKQAVDRLRVAASVFRAAELNVAPGPEGPRDDRGQLPPRRRHHPRRDRRPGRAHPGRVQPRRGAARPRQRPGRAALRDGPGPARRDAPRPPRRRATAPTTSRRRHDAATETTTNRDA